MEEPLLPSEGEEGSQPSTAASGPEKDPAIFSVRIVSIDYYMARPIPGVDVCYSSFQGEKVNEVPVIRVDGSTPAGQKLAYMCIRLYPICMYHVQIFLSIQRLKGTHLQMLSL
ncbi:hypothetical protein ACJRO7_011158 [Eucalyptus globulus]|uniref:DNA polymerase zeta catalytic subunit N-terminal domain-containing protein n=1 Tax=Eucalyptus globulus TaxID=34317 RepID=A0ABD3LED0_EUCGL